MRYKTVDLVRPTFCTAGPDAFVILARVGTGAVIERIMARPILPDGSMGDEVQMGGAYLSRLTLPNGLPLDPASLPSLPAVKARAR